MKRTAATVCLSLLIATATVNANTPGEVAAALSPALTAPKASEGRLLDITQLGDHLFSVGDQGVILSSNDGELWEQLDSPANVMFTRVTFASAKLGFILGYDSTILRSEDAGQSWQLVNHNPNGPALFDLLMLDDQRGLAVGGYGELLKTADRGSSWQAEDSMLYDIGMHLNSVLLLGDGSLFVVGERGVMARSTDDGQSWTLLDAPYGGSLFGAEPYGDQGVLIYGMRGNVFSATDLSVCGAADPLTWDPYNRDINFAAERITQLGWKKYSTPIQESLFGASSASDGTITMVGVNGTTLLLKPESDEMLLLDVSAAETLANVLDYKGRLLAVGRRGVQTLSTTTEVAKP